MILVKCDRCGSEMRPTDRIGYIAWNFKNGINGDITENNPLEQYHFCVSCMEQVMKTISDKPEPPKKRLAEPEVIKKLTPPKKKESDSRKKITDPGKMWALKKAGWTYAKIAEEMDVSISGVNNWFTRHKDEEYK